MSSHFYQELKSCLETLNTLADALGNAIQGGDKCESSGIGIANSTQRSVFLTGSRVYGQNYRTAQSDIDIVLLFEDDCEFDFVCDAIVGAIDDANIEGLHEKFKPKKDDYRYKNDDSAFQEKVVVRHGIFNLIILNNRKEYELWLEATNELILNPPADKKQARLAFYKRGL